MLCFLSVLILSITVLCLRSKSYRSVDSSCPLSVLRALCQRELLFLLFIFNAIGVFLYFRMKEATVIVKDCSLRPFHSVDTNSFSLVM